MKPSKSLVFIGFKGCGKSYFGQKLAERHQLPWIDTDILIESACGGAHYRTVYRERGEEPFRALETELLTQLNITTPTMISLGGGTPLAQIHRLGTPIHLFAQLSTLRSRLPPEFLEGNDPEPLYLARLPLYTAAAHTTLSLEGKTDDDVLSLLEEILYGQ